MMIFVDHKRIPSPFRVLRESSGFDLDGMAEAVCVKPSLLKELETDRWPEVEVGASVAFELLARVACVVSVRHSVPSVGGDDLYTVWAEPHMLLGDSFNNSWSK